MGAGALGYVFGIMMFTVLVGYVILAIFLIKPLRQYEEVGLWIAAVITGVLVYAGASVSGDLMVNLFGWATGIGFVGWRATRKSKQKQDGQESGTSN